MCAIVKTKETDIWCKCSRELIKLNAVPALLQSVLLNLKDPTPSISFSLVADLSLRCEVQYVLNNAQWAK